MKLKIGIIGCGAIATAKHLPALSKLKNVEVVAFCDLILEKASHLAKKYGTKNAMITTDYQQVMNNSEIDVIHVCTPNNSHAEISIAALNHGKHVMCEKPMAKTYEEAKAMYEASLKNNKQLSVSYQNRFRADTIYLKKLCESNYLGEIYYAKAKALRRRAVPTWGVFLDEQKQGGGPLIDVATHALDLTLWLMNNYEVDYVVGTTYHKLSRIENAANEWGSWDPKKFTVEDSGFGFVKMRNGATIVIESSWALNTLDIGEAKTTLCGTQAGADMENGLSINGEEHGQLYTKKIEFGSAGIDFNDGGSKEPHDVEAKLWIDSIV
ncbi:MAG: Gfo/Idh/MocA family oxidoreductase, partial [Acholeplasmataceae bacterium]|nr:Gfo/Idh/MocA family oxidoreductase [Acholeplasmataceae bacterium]